MEQTVIILGAKGMLGGELKKVFPGAVAWDREDIDATDTEGLRQKISSLTLQPSALINCVAFNDVDGAEERREVAFLLNGETPGRLAGLAKELGIPFVHFSSNYVFDGESGEYREDDAPQPLSAYGESKAAGERAVQQQGGRYYIVRTAVLFGPKGESELSKKSFIDIMLELSQKTDTVRAVSDEVNSVTFAKDLAEHVKMLVEGGSPAGIYHVTNSGQASWLDLAREIFSITGKDIKLEPVPSTEFPRKAIRPKKSVLLNTKLPTIRPWQVALREFLMSQSKI